MIRRLRWSGRSARLSRLLGMQGRRPSFEPLEERRMLAGDTEGPRIVGVEVTGFPGYDLLSSHPDAGPTPSVQSLTIRIEDGPDRMMGALDAALDIPPAQIVDNFLLWGNTHGQITIAGVTVQNLDPELGEPALATIRLDFGIRLPDDRYKLLIFDSLSDPSGNPLDGEANFGLPSGDGNPGGTFDVMFTVDTVAELGTWAAGSVYLDLNGNFAFDPNVGDPANRDIAVTLGFGTDYIFAGNFVEDDEDIANGFDKLAAYGFVGGRYRWLIDFGGQFDPFKTFTESAGFNGTGMPVAGDFDGDPDNGDEIGLFTGTEWIFDTDHDFSLADELRIASGIRGLPVVGDFDGDGLDDLATWDATSNTFFFSETSAMGGSTNPIETQRFQINNGFQFSGVRERPVAGDLDGDGLDELGLFVPDRSGVPPEEVAEWYFFSSRNANQISVGVTDRLALGQTALNFVPVPFGSDIFAQFGDEFALPIVGNFGPPDGIELPIPKKGDFNLDDVVDQLDYELWRATFGATTDLRADGNEDGQVNAPDYTVWRDNLEVSENTSASGAVAASAISNDTPSGDEADSSVAGQRLFWLDRAFESLSQFGEPTVFRREAGQQRADNSDLLLLLTGYLTPEEDETTPRSLLDSLLEVEESESETEVVTEMVLPPLTREARSAL